MSAWIVYLVCVCGNIREVLATLAVILFVGSFLAVLIFGIAHDEFEDITIKKAVRTIVAAIISGIIMLCGYALIPTTNQAAAILVIPKAYNAVAENKEMQKLPANIVDLANKWIDELKPKETPK